MAGHHRLRQFGVISYDATVGKIVKVDPSRVELLAGVAASPRLRGLSHNTYRHR